MNKTVYSILAVSGLALATGAQAATITDSFSVGPLTTDLTTATATGDLNQFDASLGTLTSISLTMTGESTSTTSLVNNAAQSQRFSFLSDLAWDFEVLAGSGNFLTGFTTALANTGGTVSLDSGATLDLGTTVDSGSVTYTFTGVDLAQFVGNGTVGIGCNTLTGTTFAGGGGNIVNNQATTALCNGEISYEFDAVTPPPPPGAVPEPASFLLIGAGLLGFSRLQAKKSS